MRFFLYLFVLLSINQSINGQSYVPQVSRLIDCPINQRIVNFGNNDVTTLSNQLPTASIPSNTVITRYFNTSTPVIITQLSLGIFDNYQITNVAQIRFGIMMVTSTSTSQSINRVAQSEEILLYATGRTIIYANLEQPTQLLPGINYAIVFWSNQPIYTATNQPINSVYNAASVTYSPNGLPYSQIMYSIQGDRALQASGCVSENDPFTAPGTQLYSFCAYGQSIIGASPLTSSSYARSTTSQSISGVIGVSSTDSGQSSAGTWNRVIAGIGTYQSINSGPYYYPSGTAPTGKVLSLGTGPITSINQRFYPTGQQRVDDGGISFVSGDGSQYVISFINQSITLTEMSRGSYSVISGAEFAGMTSQSTNSLTNIPVCLPPSKYTPDTFNCPINQSPISYGDDSLADSLAQYSSPTYYMYANFIFFNHQFTVRTPNTVLKQLTFRIFDNPNKVAKIRLAIYQSNASAASLPTYSMVEQTREVTLVNPSAGLIAINLLRDLPLIEGQNYTIAVLSDQFLYCSYGYQLPGPYSSSFPYEVIATNSMPSTVSSISTIYTLPLGANGCVANQQIRTVPICANFVYADRVDQYYGTLDVLATTARNSDRGSYYDVVGGRGFSNRSTSAILGNWTVKSYYLPSNNRVYLTSLNPGRNLPLVDASGIQIVVSNPNAGYAVQMSSWVDPASASIEYKQQFQTFSTTVPSVMGNLLMATLSIGEVGSSLQCVAPARPRNIVSPATVARIICPNNENSIIDTFGDASVGNFERNADGTTIEANRIYTNAFVAESTGTVRQLAIGILNNADKVGENRVRLGLYDATTGALLGQCAQLLLNEAVDQLIVMNLPTAVTIEAGRRYYIAVIASSVLEVATSAQANSPSMTSTFSTTGLPATFASTGDAVSVSVGAYVCVSSTHSICAYFQYAPAIGSSTTLMYQALAQASPTSQTNAYGTYRTVTAFAGRVTQYSRTASSPTNALSLFLFTMRSGTTANLYTASSNGYALDTQGVMLDFVNGATSQMQFNASINKMDESFRLVDKETDLIYSGIRIQELTPGGAIASCGLPSVPKSVATNVPAPSCPAGQTLVSFGDADQEDVTNNQEGLYSAPASQIFLRQITTGTGSGFLMHQVKFGININYNTVNRIRMGLYDANYTFMAGTQEIIMYNPDNQVFTGTLTTPQYLAPSTIYYLAWWTEAAVYAGFSSVAGPAGTYPFSGPWPTTFENKNPNSQRAIAALGCTTSVAPPRPQPGTDSTSSSSSSSNLSGGAVAGIVIGCVIGTNLLLLACLWLCCLGTVGAAKGAKHMELEESRTTNVELGEVSTQA